MFLRRDQAAVIHVERQAFPEERVELCTEELDTVDVVMKYHGNRFLTGDLASLAPIKESLFDLNTDAAAREHEESSGPSRRRHEAL